MAVNHNESDKRYREAARAALEGFSKTPSFGSLTPKSQDEKAIRRHEKWIRLTENPNRNAPERPDNNLLHIEVDDMIEDAIPDARILARVVTQLVREQARTANALEDIRDLLKEYYDD